MYFIVAFITLGWTHDQLTVVVHLSSIYKFCLLLRDGGFWLSHRMPQLHTCGILESKVFLTEMEYFFIYFHCMLIFSEIISSTMHFHVPENLKVSELRFKLIT